jgi:hypothetical protein
MLMYLYVMQVEYSEEAGQLYYFKYMVTGSSNVSHKHY